MLDSIGNKITAGQYLYWKDKDMFVRVVEVNEATVIGNEAMPVLTILMQLPVKGVERGREAVMADFLRVVDPAAESRLDAAMMELPGRAQ